MSEYGKYVTEYMFYENDEEEIMDLEGRKTGGKQISQNILSVENVYAIRAWIEVMKVEGERRTGGWPKCSHELGNWVTDSLDTEKHGEEKVKLVLGIQGSANEWMTQQRWRRREFGKNRMILGMWN